MSLTANDLFAEMGYGNTAPEEPVEALALSMLKEVYNHNRQQKRKERYK